MRSTDVSGPESGLMRAGSIMERCGAMKKRLLLVDDNRHLQVTLGDHLAHDGYEVTVKDSAEDALAFLESGGETDLIILDINMPGIGGLGFLNRILGDDGRLAYPVLVLTARSGMDSFFNTVPIDGFLPKPCLMDVLLAKVREILDREPGEHPRAAEGGPQSKAPAGRVVLLAEDDVVVAERASHLLQSMGCRTVVVRSGPDVLDAAARLKPQLVILKQLLPKMNGSVIAPVLAGMPSARGVPILLYDESRRFEDPGLFGARLPHAVTRYVASNRAADLMRAAATLLAEQPAPQKGS